MKRFFVSLGLVVMALVSGIAFNIHPEQAAAEPDVRYVALGDSVAAGLGLSGSTADTTCGRSTDAYAYQVAQSRGYDLELLACSGAKVDEGLYGAQNVQGSRLTPQLDAAFANGTPDVMTITIGANDVRWAQFVRDCYLWNCGSKWDDVRAQAYLLDLRWELYRTFSEIETRSQGAAPRVVITGYFSPFAAPCDALPRITQTEINWLNSQVRSLNYALSESTVGFDFATFAPVSFAGHEICTADPWVQAFGTPAAIHPTVAGQQAIADAITDVL